MINTSIKMGESKPSIVSEGFVFTGDIVAEGALHVEGHIKGTIMVDAVTIGPRGVVDGTIECGRLYVKGTYRGTATCDELVIDSAASVNGSVTYRTLTAQRGAAIVGTLVVRK
ncbi:MAG: polymer-forming cytoskeletal protein [Vicinamibacterales bacterium]